MLGMTREEVASGELSFGHAQDKRVASLGKSRAKRGACVAIEGKSPPSETEGGAPSRSIGWWRDENKQIPRPEDATGTHNPRDARDDNRGVRT